MKDGPKDLKDANLILDFHFKGKGARDAVFNRIVELYEKENHYYWWPWLYWYRTL